MKGQVFVGLMSGTSLDGVDAVVADFSTRMPLVLGTHAVGIEPALRSVLLALAESAHGEIETACEAGLALAALYASATRAAIQTAGLLPGAITAIGCHGQTIRHRPERGYTIQIGAPALLAETTGITVVADFRSADIAAGGQGAPLAPGFHAACLADPAVARIVLNLGGIANVTRLIPGQPVIGFDCGPANILLDAWIEKQRDERFDRDGTWARGGKVDAPLLERMLAEPFLALPAPKSTGRDLFNLAWVERHLDGREPAQDVQSTLLALTVESIGAAVESICERSGTELIACGGGARNTALIDALARRCKPAIVRPSEELGIAPEAIEPLAFAWLARERI